MCSSRHGWKTAPSSILRITIKNFMWKNPAASPIWNLTRDLHLTAAVYANHWISEKGRSTTLVFTNISISWGSNMQVLTEVHRCQIHCCSIVNRFLMRDTNTLAQLQLHLDQIIHLLKIHSDVAIFWKCFEYLCNDSTTITELILTARMMYFIPHTWQRFEFPQIVFLRLCVTSITCIPTFCTLRFIKLT